MTNVKTAACILMIAFVAPKIGDGEKIISRFPNNKATNEISVPNPTKPVFAKLMPLRKAPGGSGGKQDNMNSVRWECILPKETVVPKKQV
jgi:hypothetical protein